MDPSVKARLLYVEDDEALRFVTQDNLEIAGYEVIGIESGTEAVKQIEDGLRFDLAILDVMLPGADGFTVAETIRAHYQQVPILFLSAKSLKEDRLKGLRIGADDYLTKPFNIEELVLKVEIFLRRRHFVERPPEEIRSATSSSTWPISRSAHLHAIANPARMPRTRRSAASRNASSNSWSSSPATRIAS